jgi:NAD(P)-dependent dehydrogenase (short-subunit alcohol dehydrogenase family)
MKEKVTVITGAASLRSIGYATAELFAEHGSKVVIVDVRMDDDIVATVRESVAAKLGRAVAIHGYRCDISLAKECDDLVRQVVALHGTIDCLVHSAGIVRSQSFMEIGAQDLDTMLDVNLKGTFHICQSVLKVFTERKAGTIVNLSSLAAQRGGGLVGGAHYAASKGGVLSLTKSIAREFGHLGIRANAVCPAMIDTPMLDGLSAERLQGITDGIPLRRVGTTREAAGACLFLASELSGFITGATIDVNGGSHIH